MYCEIRERNKLGTQTIHSGNLHRKNFEIDIDYIPENNVKISFFIRCKNLSDNLYIEK